MIPGQAREPAAHGYPRGAGPGAYDLHSPRLRSHEEAMVLLHKGLEARPADRTLRTQLATRTTPPTP